MYSRAGFIQFEVQYGKPFENLETVKKLLDGMQPEPDTLLVLPELWATGFDYQHAENLADETPGLLAGLTTLAGKYSLAFAGSLMEAVRHAEDVRIYNTMFYVAPEGVVGKYRKRHLFALWQEDQFFHPGGLFLPAKTPWGLVGGLVCYDLRFPEIARKQAFEGAALFAVSAQWPAVRLDHWKILLQARAVENQAFIAACNGCGRTGDNDLGGNSMIVAPDGTILHQGGGDEEAHALVLDTEDMDKLRQRFCPPGESPRKSQDRFKQVGLEELLERLEAIRFQGSRIAFTNGCFDILHSGHVAYLEKARETADCLVVGLNSDTSVQALKGKGRPINTENERGRVLAALGCVDFIVLFSEETPLKLITAVQPDVLVKGADWSEDQIVGAREVRAGGGDVVRVAFEHEMSTTDVISRIKAKGE